MPRQLLLQQCVPPVGRCNITRKALACKARVDSKVFEEYVLDLQSRIKRQTESLEQGLGSGGATSTFLQDRWVFNETKLNFGLQLLNLLIILVPS
jgi:hypothetical protein